MTQATGTDRTVGEAMASSEVIAGAIGTIVEEVGRHSAQITDVRPASPGLADSYEAVLERAANVRGRKLMYPYVGSGIGNGALVELLDGSVKWDMITGIGVHYFGHSDPDLIKAGLEAGLDDTLKHGNLMSNMEAFRFGEVLLEEAKKGSKLSQCFLSTSGAMANENALKVCFQKHAPAPRVIAFQDCFMGRSITMAQIGDSPGNRVGLPTWAHVDYMPFYDEVGAKRMGEARYIDMCVKHLEWTINRYPNQHACFIFELVQGEGGFRTAPRDFFKALMECCKAHNVAVWDDEIQSFGRTEQMFAYDYMDLGEYVDVFCVGKMTQACATLYTDEYAPKPGLLSGTFTGEGSTFRVGTRVVERLRDGGYYGPDGSNAAHHRAFCEQVRALASAHPEWFPANDEVADVCGGVGGMMRMTPFGGDKAKIWRLCQVAFEEGLIVFYCGHGPFHLRMLPPLGVFDVADWPRVFEVLERAMARVASEG